MAVYTENEIRKVILQKKSSQKNEGNGEPTSDNVDIEYIDSDDEEQDGENGEQENEKDKEQEQGEQEGGEGEEGEGEGEGKGEKSKQGKSGKGKSGKDSKETQKDIDAIKKAADELYEEMKNVDKEHTSCGSVEKRIDKQKEEIDKDPDAFKEDEKLLRERIKEILNKALDEGIEHPLRQSDSSRGEGGKDSSNAPKGDLIPVPMKKPEFLKKMKDFANSEFEKVYFKKGTDWFYTQGYGDIFFKDRPKISLPKKSVYLLIDVSGSMFSDFGGTGKSLLEHLIGYLPIIAEEFSGQVWWISDGLLQWQKGYGLPKELEGKKAITPLSFFKKKTSLELSQFFKQVQNAKGSGGGTTFNTELQLIQNIREKEKNNAPIIVLSDGMIDYVKTEYFFPIGSKTKIQGTLPPNTYIMTDPNGIKYMHQYYDNNPKKGYFDYEKNIQYYDITENGKYKINLKGKKF